MLQCGSESRLQKQLSYLASSVSRSKWLLSSRRASPSNRQLSFSSNTHNDHPSTSPRSFPTHFLTRARYAMRSPTSPHGSNCNRSQRSCSHFPSRSFSTEGIPSGEKDPLLAHKGESTSVDSAEDVDRSNQGRKRGGTLGFMSSGISSAPSTNDKKEDKENDTSTSKDGGAKAKVSFREANFRRLAALARPELPNLAKATGGLVVSTGVTMAIPAAFGQIIDIASGVSQTISLPTLIPFLGATFTVGAAATFVRVYYFTIAGERVVARLRRHLFTSIISQEIGFFDKSRTGELINRLSADTVEMGKCFSGMTLSSGLRSTTQFISALSIMMYLSPALTAVMLGVIPIGYGGARIYGRYVRAMSEKLQKSLSQATAVAEERLGSVRTVRSFANEQLEINRYTTEVDNVFNLAKRLGFASASFFSGATLAGNFAMLGVLSYGAHLISMEQISPGTLTSFLLYTIYVGMNSMQITSFYAEVMRGLGASTRVFELLDRIPQIDNTKGISPDDLVGRVTFDKVAFRYPTRKEVPVFEDLSFEVTPGSVMAVVGSSGSGKSTITSLLLRFYDPKSGRVLLDGTDTQEINPTWLRQHISIVSQEPTLFSGTIAENIMYGLNKEHSDDLLQASLSDVPEEVVRSAREANAHNFISSFPNGYDTLVGEKGMALSGGQKQRIAIARALLKNPKILLLDEATSALDAESEQLVQEALERAMKNRTVIVIAHRLSTVQNADKIAVLENGRIVEVGSHSDLMARTDSSYRNLMSIQLGLSEAQLSRATTSAE